MRNLYKTDNNITKNIFTKKLSQQSGFSLLELMIAATMGITVIAMTTKASGVLNMVNKRNQANLSIQETRVFVTTYIGNLLKSTNNSPCNNLNKAKKIEHLIMPSRQYNGGVIPIKDSWGKDFITNPSDIFTFYANHFSDSPANLPVDFPQIKNIVPNTDYFIVMNTGKRGVVTDFSDDLVDVTYTTSKLEEQPTKNNIYLMSNCNYTQLFQLQSDGEKNQSTTSTFTLDGVGYEFSNVSKSKTFIMPVDYQAIYIGKDSDGKIGLMTISLIKPNAMAQMLVQGITNLQIMWGVKKQTNGLQYQELVGSDSFADRDEMDNVNTAAITFSFTPLDAGFISKNALENKEFISHFTFRNNIE